MKVNAIPLSLKGSINSRAGAVSLDVKLSTMRKSIISLITSKPRPPEGMESGVLFWVWVGKVLCLSENSGGLSETFPVLSEDLQGFIPYFSRFIRAIYCSAVSLKVRNFPLGL